MAQLRNIKVRPGAEAVDLLVGQLHAHEYGIPRREKVVSVSGTYQSIPPNSS